MRGRADLGQRFLFLRCTRGVVLIDVPLDAGPTGQGGGDLIGVEVQLGVYIGVRHHFEVRKAEIGSDDVVGPDIECDGTACLVFRALLAAGFEEGI